MTLFNKRFTKTIGAFGAMVFFMSCTNEIPEDTAGLIANDNFVRETIGGSTPPVLSTKEVDLVVANSKETFLLGDYNNSVFGDLKTSIVAPVTSESFPLARTTSSTPENVVSSEVSATLEIVLDLSLKEGSETEYEVAGLIGDVNSIMEIEVKTFTTYLERFNASGTERVYYSNGTNDAGSKENLGNETLLGSLSGLTLKETYDVASDTIRIPLDSYDFKANLLDKLDQQAISNNNDLRELFKGVKIDMFNSDNGFLLPLDLKKARLIIDYKNKEGDNETTEESLNFQFDIEIALNNGGRTKITHPIIHNLYNHNHNLNSELGKVYVQGAGGYEVSVNISDFINANRSAYRDEQWLVNQATLKIYVDDSNPITDETLSEFYIYAINKDDEVIAIDDYTFFSVAAVDGVLRYDDTDNQRDPFIRFFITDFIKDVLSYNIDGETVTGLDIKELRVKAREPGESAFVDLRSTTAKGIVLLNDTSSDKAPKLEVAYSKLEQ